MSIPTISSPLPVLDLSQKAVTRLRKADKDYNGVTRNELEGLVKELDTDKDGVLDLSKDKLDRAGYQAADLELLNAAMTRTADFEPGEVVFAAVKRSTQASPTLKVRGYALGDQLSPADLAAEIKSSFGPDYKPEAGGCAKQASHLLSLVSGKPRKVNNLVNDPSVKQVVMNGKRSDAPNGPSLKMSKGDLNKLIEDGSLKPGMVILINTDASMRLPDGPNDKTDRHWFTYLGKDAQGEPRFLDNFGYGQSEYESGALSQTAAKPKWVQWMKNKGVEGAQHNSADYMERFFRIGFDKDYEHNGTDPESVIHSVLDPYAAPEDRARFEAFAAELLGLPQPQ